MFLRRRRFLPFLPLFSLPPPAVATIALFVAQAPEPSDVKWENLDVSPRSRKLRKALTSLVCVVLLIVSFGIIYLAQNEQVSYKLGDNLYRIHIGLSMHGTLKALQPSIHYDVTGRCLWVQRNSLICSVRENELERTCGFQLDLERRKGGGGGGKGWIRP